MPMVFPMLTHILVLPFFLPITLQPAQLALPETVSPASKYGAHGRVILEIRLTETSIETSDTISQKRFLAIISLPELNVAIQGSNIIVLPEVLQKRASTAALGRWKQQMLTRRISWRLVCDRWKNCVPFYQ